MVYGTLGPSLLAIVNKSLSLETLPVDLKHPLVVPTLKKPNLDPADPANYRPISNLPFLAKILEKVVQLQ